AAQVSRRLNRTAYPVRLLAAAAATPFKKVHRLCSHVDDQHVARRQNAESPAGARESCRQCFGRNQMTVSHRFYLERCLNLSRFEKLKTNSALPCSSAFDAIALS